MIRAIEGIAKENAITEIVFMFMLEDNKREITIFEEDKYQKIFLSSPGILNNSFHSFNEYIESLKPNSRSIVRREIKNFVKSGNVLEIVNDPVNQLASLYKLANNIQEKHEMQSPAYTLEKMKLVFENMKEYLSCFIVRTKNDIIGTVSLLEKDGVLITYALGLDYEETKKSSTYFYLFYYNSIMEMINRRIGSIDFDMNAYIAKERRGCRLVPQYILIKPLKRKLFFMFWKHLLNHQYRKKFHENYLGKAKIDR